MDFIEYLGSVINANIAFVFGACLLFGVLGGILANRIQWMPTITAFMLLGFIVGPHGLGLISASMLKEASVFVDIALGLILYKLGNMLHPKAMLKSRRLIALAVAEGTLTFIAVMALCLWMELSFLLAAMISAICVSSSPSVLVHVTEELRAMGPITDRAKSLVAINNILAFILFSVVLPFGMVDGERSTFIIVGVPLYRLMGAVLVGILTAWIAEKINRMLRPQDAHYKFAIAIGAIMLSMGLCKSFGISALFAPLVLGIAIRFFETPESRLSRMGLGEGGDLFFIVLFVLSGAKIDPLALVEIGWLPILIVLVRTLAKSAGIYVAGRFNGVTARQSTALSLMLIPMAGMAIGLVSTANKLTPDVAAQLSAIIFGMVAIFETIGPFLVTYAIRIAGEAGKADELENMPEDEAVI